MQRIKPKDNCLRLYNHLTFLKIKLIFRSTWRNWLAHFPDKEEVECSSHSVDTKINKL